MTRVMIVEDHTLVRESVVKLIDSEPGLEVAGETARAEEVLALIARNNPDILLIDVGLGRHDGIELAATIRRAHPGKRIIFLTMHDQDSYLRRAMEVGADGFVLKSNSINDLLEAVRVVADGGTYLSPQITRRVMEIAGGRDMPAADLTEREREVLELIAGGARPSEIAEKLVLSIKTVKNHLTRVYAKLGVESAHQAVAEAYRIGLVAPGDELNGSGRS